MPLEQWNTIFEVAGIVLLSLTVLSGTGALITANRINANNKAVTRQINLTLEEQKERTANAEIAQRRVETELSEQRERTAQQQERTANAEKELLELQEKLQPRRFSAEQKEKLIGALKTLPNKPHTVIECVSGDSDSMALATQLRLMLDAAGFPPGTDALSSFIPVNPVGVLLTINRRGNSPFGSLMVQALADARIEYTTVEDPNAPPDSLRIRVGVKPQ